MTFGCARCGAREVAVLATFRHTLTKQRCERVPTHVQLLLLLLLLPGFSGHGDIVVDGVRVKRR